MNVDVKPVKHRGGEQVALYFPYNKALISVAKKLGCQWSQSKQYWYLPMENNIHKKIIAAYYGKAYVDASALFNGQQPKAISAPQTNARPAPAKAPIPITVEIPEAFIAKLKSRQYASSTYKSYTGLFKAFLQHFAPKAPENISEQEIKDYLLLTVEKRNLSPSTQNQIINSIKFYYEKVLGWERKTYWLDRPRKERRLPVVASEDEIVMMLVAAKNLKHQCIIGMLYSAGLRRGELINLRIADIDTDREQVFIRAAKGKKDRMSILSKRMIVALNTYMAQYKPRYWLFEGLKQAKYSGTSIGKVVKNAATKAGIKKSITPHVLRHSFATHLMDKGTDTRYIQELLGHASLNTTALYAHVSTRDLQNITSPLDRIFADKAIDTKHLKPPTT